MTEEIAGVLDLLAERFGTTVEYLWGVVVITGRVRGVCWLVLLLGMLGITYALVKSVNKSWPKWWKENIPDVIPFATSAFAFIMLLITVVSLVDILTMIFVPEYWALEYFLRHLGG